MEQSAPDHDGNPFASVDQAIDFLAEIQPPTVEDPQLLGAARTFQQLGTLMDSSGDAGCDVDYDQLAQSVMQGAALMQLAIQDPEQAGQAVDLANELSDIFEGFVDMPTDADQWFGDENPLEEASDESFDSPSAEEISQLLGQIQQENVECEEESHVPQESAASPGNFSSDVVDVSQSYDNELREAFLDDARRCLGEMEKALLTLESNPDDPAPLQLLGRELHTIKGASASIGLSDLASFIHEVEDKTQALIAEDQQVDVKVLLNYVDTIRSRVDSFQNQDSNEDSAAVHFDPLAQHSDQDNERDVAAPTIDFDDSDDQSVRIQASRLNRMMDMLSELVMLRNQRDTELTNLVAIHESLIEGVTRIRNICYEDLESPSLASTGSAGNAEQLNEVANDIVELAQHLQESYRPVADGNVAVSQFIRSFRQELVELRRTPIEGLFRRLRRAISDAARSEQKNVQLILHGEDTGIDRSLQSRLFEPLLHIVRNAVSHGIEEPAQRTEAGKSEQGTITLHAHCGPDLLTIEVRDDGRGLDYDAIRRRGLERGLISAGSSASRAELAQLIFHPGFSTRDSASQISGRGVGMEVVASTLERMRGWVEVDSARGQGTTIRLSLPLPSMIQHAMVFRSSGQLFAVPMQAVQSAGAPDDRMNLVCVSQLLDLHTQSAIEHSEMIVLGTQSVAGEREPQLKNTAILVDQIIGPEEVVVRPLPKLFKQHPICSGATLSGLGEIVLLLDAKRLSEACVSMPSEQPRAKQQPRRSVLVVDDSTSARLRTIKCLNRYGFHVIQARDGSEALESLSENPIDMIFSDIEMPKVSGLELLSAVKSDDQFAHIPVVLISSRTEPEFTGSAMELGAVACLPKPVNDASLDAAIAAIPSSSTHSTSSL